MVKKENFSTKLKVEKNSFELEGKKESDIVYLYFKQFIF